MNPLRSLLVKTNLLKSYKVIYNIRKYVSSNNSLLQKDQKNVYLVDENDNSDHEINIAAFNKFTNRSFTCGELNTEHIGLRVSMCGWLEFHRMGKFLVLRDGYGQTQFLIENNSELAKKLAQIPFESILKIEGTVVARPADMINRKQATGEIEVLVKSLEVLNECKSQLPFNIREFQKAKESLRMQYRYLDMRFPEMQRNLRVRSKMLKNMREFLVDDCGFVDVETPTLFKATPGGAQEFVVPTRFPGQFYSLVQSPQQFKQMLMAGGIDRYFQIARCYRDETSRPDRQPEFTQLDIEMSFTSMEGIMKLTEELLQYSWPSFLDPIPRRFNRKSFKEVFEIYGTDKPDLRYDFKIRDCTEFLESNDAYAGCLVFHKPLGNLTKSVRERLNINQFPGTKMIMKKIKYKDDFAESCAKILTREVGEKIFDKCELKEDSIVFLVFGEKNNALKRLGKLRTDFVDHLEECGHKIKKAGMHFMWIVDFPLFEEEDGKLCSVHHPFTSPNYEDLHLIRTNPLQVRSQSYDLILNGNEIAGGSIRVHNADLQKELLSLLDIKTDSLMHMLDMLSLGCPPHGGIAIGLDRLLSLLLHTKSIRDVIAFPKTFDGKDPLSGAPNVIGEADKKLYHIKSIE
ncbi:PREDICTED: aspartate--tRNA ligase, mitochondrial [Nicrophorus vespilloides]|uniref:Aspartate--tRNA ligase, mitochondrial n=1 Tax=Nicrophorus vespilloides TaxID=110193 RepID=A0ABM1NBV0_NICVS|nr:PREDICTED: aspartate--tRNA ligase, mitochondrial [Nicrophorus vespilloides]